MPRSVHWLGINDVPQVLLLGCASVTFMGRLGELGPHGESGTRMLGLVGAGPVPM